MKQLTQALIKLIAFCKILCAKKIARYLIATIISAFALVLLYYGFRILTGCLLYVIVGICALCVGAIVWIMTESFLVKFASPPQEAQDIEINDNL